MSSNADGVDLDILAILVNENRLDIIGRLASVTLLLFDIIITLDREARYFWKKPLGFVTLIFFLNRYPQLILAIVDTFRIFYLATDTSCQVFGWFFELCDWGTMILIDAILTIRVHALYERNRVFLYYLAPFLLAEAAVMFAIVVKVHLSLSVEAFVLANILKGCSENGFPILWATCYWIPSLLYEITLLILTIYKIVQFWRDGGIHGVPGLVGTLARDQVLYFIVVLACGTVNISVYWVNNTQFLSVASVFVIPMVCIVGSRILLNLREAADHRIVVSGGAGGPHKGRHGNDSDLNGSRGQVVSEMRFVLNP